MRLCSFLGSNGHIEHDFGHTTWFWHDLDFDMIPRSWVGLPTCFRRWMHFAEDGIGGKTGAGSPVDE